MQTSIDTRTALRRTQRRQLEKNEFANLQATHRSNAAPMFAIWSFFQIRISRAPRDLSSKVLSCLAFRILTSRDALVGFQ
jgi:hypothetical protein